jgi:RNA polymerase sigma factor (sigma-70 family)
MSEPLKPIPQAVARILQQPGREWTAEEIVEVFTWVVEEKVDGLTWFAYSQLRSMRGPETTLEDAKDAVADTLLAARKYLPSFDPEKGSFLRWVYVSLSNSCKRKRPTLEIDIEDPEGSVNVRELPDPAAVDFDGWSSLRDVRWGISRLQDPYRTALTLYLDDYSYAQIAQAQAITVIHSRVRVCRAKQMLKALLAEDTRIPTLPEPYRGALILHRRGGSYAAIAQVQGCTIQRSFRPDPKHWKSVK